jgi:hypothetical protein
VDAVARIENMLETTADIAESSGVSAPKSELLVCLSACCLTAPGKWL